MILPKFRTTTYAIWKACERFGILPPGIKTTWDDNVPWTQGLLLAYSQIRDMEEAEDRSHTGAAVIAAMHRG